jgi:hypothetical protein
MSKATIELSNDMKEIISEVRKGTVLTKQDVVNWFANEGCYNYFDSNSREDLIDDVFETYAKYLKRKR